MRTDIECEPLKICTVSVAVVCCFPSYIGKQISSLIVLIFMASFYIINRHIHSAVIGDYMEANKSNIICAFTTHIVLESLSPCALLLHLAFSHRYRVSSEPDKPCNLIVTKALSLAS
eukprot:971723_1